MKGIGMGRACQRQPLEPTEGSGSVRDGQTPAVWNTPDKNQNPEPEAESLSLLPEELDTKSEISEKVAAAARFFFVELRDFEREMGFKRQAARQHELP